MSAVRFSKVLESFEKWDADGNGTIDRKELAAILSGVSYKLTDAEIDRLMTKIDLNSDGQINYEEFFEWLTNTSHTWCLTPDGWLDNFNLDVALRPLFDSFDSDKSGFISEAEFLESYQILTNCLKMHPSSRADGWIRDPESELRTIDQDGDNMVSFDEFMRWQRELLKNSGIPNSDLPALLDELSASLQLIFDIDNMCKRGEGHDGSGSVETLSKSIAVVSFAGRMLYSHANPQETHIQKVQADFVKIWSSAPTPTDMQALVRFCAKVKGILLPMWQKVPGEDEKEKVNTSCRRSLFAKKKVLDRKCSKAIGQVKLCIPVITDGEASSWFAEIVKARMYGSEESYRYEMTSARRWVALEDDTRFQSAVDALPQEILLFSILSGQTFMSNELDWESLQRALANAVHMKLIDDDTVKMFNEDMREEVRDQLVKADRHHELQDLGKTMDEAVEERLTEIQISPADAVAALSQHFQRRPEAAALDALLAMGKVVSQRATCATDKTRRKSFS